MTEHTFEDEIRGAFEGVEPTEEQRQRMLSNLREAQARMQADTAGADSAASADDELQNRASDALDPGRAPSTRRAKGFSLLKVAVPLAACLAVGAIVIGVSQSTSYHQGPASPTAPAAVQATPSAEQQSGGQAPQVEAKTGGVEQAAQDDAALLESSPMAAGSANAKNETAYVDVEALAYEEDMGELEEGLVLDAGEGFNTEEYRATNETGFVSTKSNPLSTVSADVDTASYCNVRRMISEGMRLEDVPDGAVRIEEMLNYFDYDYKLPSGDELFGMQAQSAVCPWNDKAQLLVMGFSAAPEDRAASKGSNLVFLIDVSGSMDSPDKLDLLQDSFATLLKNLGPDDRVSIVTYASGEDIVLEGAHGDDSTAILKAIYKLRADGSTNGEAGLKQAYEVAARNFIEGGVNRIVMASDGDLNVGVTSESDLYDLVDGKRESGVYLSVLGFGTGNYKDNKMETLADHGNGSYHYIDSVEEANRVLSEKLTANLVPFADDVKVQVEFNPSQVKAYRLIGYENRALADEDFRNDEVDAGDVGPGAQFTVAYELIMSDSDYELAEPDLKYADSQDASGSGSDEWLTCSLRYRSFSDGEMHEQQQVVDAACASASPDANWNLAAAISEFGMVARGSEYVGNSDVDTILDLLANAGDDEQVASFRKLVVRAMG